MYIRKVCDDKQIHKNNHYEKGGGQNVTNSGSDVI